MYQEAKISELSSFQIQEEKDFLLKSEKNFDADGAFNLKQPYTSHRIEISALFDAMFSRERKISASWNFLSVPEQTIRFDINDFVNTVLLNQANRNDAINLTGGFYTNISEGYEDIVDPLSVSTYAIANIDYVNRVAALVYGTLLNMVNSLSNIQICPSRVGDVIHSTTLSIKNSYNGVAQSDSNGDAMVRNIFGAGRTVFKFGNFELKEPNTKWKLSAQNRIIATALNASDLGKEDGSATVLVNSVLNHNHVVKDPKEHGHSTGSVTAKNSQKGMNVFNGGHPDADSGKQSAAGGYDATLGIPKASGTANGRALDAEKTQTSSNPVDRNGRSNGQSATSINIEQAYKDVFVWARIS